MLVSFRKSVGAIRGLTLTICSLEKQPNRRASPWKMMEHPWMVEMQSKRVNMVKYLSFVWGWDANGPPN